MSDLVDDLLGFIVIINPFALCLYLTGVMDDLEDRDFLRVMVWASALSFGVFAVFAFFGDFIVIRVFGVGPEALKIFGGLIISVVAYGYVMRGYRAVEALRGTLDELPSAIAVPFMVGAGSLTKSILVGKTHTAGTSALVILVAIAVCLTVVLAFKHIRAGLRRVHERVFDRYINLLSRINGLLLGAVGMDMIVVGIREVWTG